MSCQLLFGTLVNKGVYHCNILQRTSFKDVIIINHDELESLLPETSNVERAKHHMSIFHTGAMQKFRVNHYKNLVTNMSLTELIISYCSKVEGKMQPNFITIMVYTRDKTNPIALCSFYISETHIFIQQLFVDPNKRRMNLATCLLSVIEDMGLLFYRTRLTIISHDVMNEHNPSPDDPDPALTFSRKMYFSISLYKFIRKGMFGHHANLMDVHESFLEELKNKSSEKIRFRANMFPIFLTSDSNVYQKHCNLITLNDIFHAIKNIIFDSANVSQTTTVDFFIGPICKHIFPKFREDWLYEYPEKLIDNNNMSMSIDVSTNNIHNDAYILKQLFQNNDIDLLNLIPMEFSNISSMNYPFAVVSEIYLGDEKLYYYCRLSMSLFWLMLSRLKSNSNEVHSMGKIISTDTLKNYIDDDDRFNFKQYIINSHVDEVTDYLFNLDFRMNVFKEISHKFLQESFPGTVNDMSILLNILGDVAVFFQGVLQPSDGITVTQKSKWMLRHSKSNYSMEPNHDLLLQQNTKALCYSYDNNNKSCMKFMKLEVINNPITKLILKDCFSKKGIMKSSFKKSPTKKLSSSNIYANKTKKKHTENIQVVSFLKEFEEHTILNVDGTLFDSSEGSICKLCTVPYLLPNKDSYVSPVITLKHQSNVASYILEIMAVIGEDYPVEVIDVKKEVAYNWKLEQLANYFVKRNHSEIYNQVSLEFSKTKLIDFVCAPGFVKENDLINTAWSGNKQNGYPKIQHYCLTSLKGSYMDFHIDMCGSSVWYNVVIGCKQFIIIAPTEENLQSFYAWEKLRGKTRPFFTEEIKDKSTIISVFVRKNEVFLIPSGYIHAVYTSIDSIVFGGNYFTIYSIAMYMKIHELEKQLCVLKKNKAPHFMELMIYSLDFIYQKVKRNEAIVVELHSMKPLVDKCLDWLECCKKMDPVLFYCIQSICKKNAVTNMAHYFSLLNASILCGSTQLSFQFFSCISHRGHNVIDLLVKYYKDNFTICNEIDSDSIRYQVVTMCHMNNYTSVFVCPFSKLIFKSIPITTDNYKRLKIVHCDRLSKGTDYCIRKYLGGKGAIDFNYHKQYFTYQTVESSVNCAIAYAFDYFNHQLLLKQIENQTSCSDIINPFCSMFTIGKWFNHVQSFTIDSCDTIIKSGGYEFECIVNLQQDNIKIRGNESLKLVCKLNQTQNQSTKTMDDNDYDQFPLSASFSDSIQVNNNGNESDCLLLTEKVLDNFDSVHKSFQQDITIFNDTENVTEFSLQHHDNDIISIVSSNSSSVDTVPGKEHQLQNNIGFSIKQNCRFLQSVNMTDLPHIYCWDKFEINYSSGIYNDMAMDDLGFVRLKGFSKSHNFETKTHKDVSVLKKSYNPIKAETLKRLCKQNKNKNEVEPGWINDELIDFWMNRLMNVFPIYCCKTKMYTKLAVGDSRNPGLQFYNRIEQWNDATLFQNDIIVIPINLNRSHWVLGVVYHPYSFIKNISNEKNQKFQIHIYDSLSNSSNDIKHKNICNNLVYWLRHEWYKINNIKGPVVDNDFSENTFELIQLPAQSNEIDCGLYICGYAYQLTQWWYKSTDGSMNNTLPHLSNKFDLLQKLSSVDHDYVDGFRCQLVVFMLRLYCFQHYHLAKKLNLMELQLLFSVKDLSELDIISIDSKLDDLDLDAFQCQLPKSITMINYDYNILNEDISFVTANDINRKRKVGNELEDHCKKHNCVSFNLPNYPFIDFIMFLEDNTYKNNMYTYLILKSGSPSEAKQFYINALATLYIDYMQQQHNNLGNNWSDKLPKNIESTSDQIKITNVRSTLVVKSNSSDEFFLNHSPLNKHADGDSIIFEVSYDWHICCFSEQNLRGGIVQCQYSPISEEKLTIIVGHCLIYNWKVLSLVYFQQCNVGRTSDTFENDDESDIDYNLFSKRRGSYLWPNQFYFSVNEQLFFVNKNIYEYSKYFFNMKTNQYVGCYKHNGNKSVGDDLSIEWMDFTHGNKFGTLIRLRSKIQNVFKIDKRVWPNGIVVLPKKYFKPSNTKLKFYHDGPSCPFLSVASVLHNMNHPELAEKIMDEKKEYENHIRWVATTNDVTKQVQRVDFLDTCKKIGAKERFVKLTQNLFYENHYTTFITKALRGIEGYKCMRISNSFDLMTHHSQNMQEDEIILIKFSDVDNEVCITKNHIYESSNICAIDFSAEAIDVIVRGRYSGIEMGLYINKRKEKAEKWLCKFNIDGKLQFISIKIIDKVSKYEFIVS